MHNVYYQHFCFDCFPMKTHFQNTINLRLRNVVTGRIKKMETKYRKFQIIHCWFGICNVDIFFFFFCYKKRRRTFAVYALYTLTQTLYMVVHLDNEYPYLITIICYSVMWWLWFIRFCIPLSLFRDYIYLFRLCLILFLAIFTTNLESTLFSTISIRSLERKCYSAIFNRFILIVV